MNDEIKEALEQVLAEENQHEAVAVARALCPFAEAATDEVMLLCVALVEAKGDDKAVAEVAGMGRARARRLLQSGISQRIIKELAKNRLKSVGYLKAVCSLIDVAESAAQTGNARNNASKTILELVEADNNKGGGDEENLVDLNNMTLKQLESYVGRIKQDMVRLPAMIDITPIDSA